MNSFDDEDCAGLDLAGDPVTRRRSAPAKDTRRTASHGSHLVVVTPETQRPRAVARVVADLHGRAGHTEELFGEGQASSAWPRAASRFATTSLGPASSIAASRPPALSQGSGALT